MRSLDIHAHVTPQCFWRATENGGDMDSLGVDVQILSTYVGFYNYQLDPAVALASSREINDEIAGMTRTWPKRFTAGLGTLPMQGMASLSQDEKDAILSTNLERLLGI